MVSANNPYRALDPAKSLNLVSALSPAVAKKFSWFRLFRQCGFCSFHPICKIMREDREVRVGEGRCTREYVKGQEPQICVRLRKNFEIGLSSGK